MSSVLYDAGTVTIISGNTRVSGVNTAWLKKDIKQYDIFILDGKFYEIADVTSNTELFLKTAYTGDSIEAAEYKILRIIPQILAADLAKQLQDVIDLFKDKEQEYSLIAQYAAKFKKAGLNVDDNHRLYQTEPEPEPIDDSDFATAEEVQSLIHDVMDN